MSTTSTVPTVKAGIKTVVEANLTDVSVWHTWPGPDAEREMIILGEVEWDEYVIPTIKTGRKQRQEEYTIAFDLVTLDIASTKPTDPTAVEDRAFTLLKAMEDALADDASAGTNFSTVQHVQLSPGTASYRDFEKGLGYVITGRIAVKSRLI